MREGPVYEGAAVSEQERAEHAGRNAFDLIQELRSRF